MAIKAIDIRSSTTAKDNKNTLRAGLNLLENKININKKLRDRNIMLVSEFDTS